MNHYFVTGATGVVGSAVVRALLETAGTRLTLLVRAKQGQQVGYRLGQLLRFVDARDDRTSGRIGALAGDVELNRLGLGEQDYGRLCKEVTHIVHCAALVRMNLPLADARRAAVTATQNVFELALACRSAGKLQKVDSVSTVGVGGHWKGAVPERWLDEAREFHNTYEQAKAEAEVVARDYIARGVPATLHRPSMVVGDSRTGRIPHFQVFYHLIEFLSGRRTFGFLPPLATRTVDLVTADYVANAIVWSSRTAATRDRILHLCAGAEGAVPLERLQSVVRQEFARRNLHLPALRTLPVSAFERIVRYTSPLLPSRLRRALGTVPVFLDYLAEAQAFSNTETRGLLEPAGVALPAAAQFLGPVLTHYLDCKYGLPSSPA